MILSDKGKLILADDGGLEIMNFLHNLNILNLRRRGGIRGDEPRIFKNSG